jgi:cation diffusion facilitator family transporter
MPAERCIRCGQRVTWLCFAGNLFMAIYKILIGILGGSGALIADGVHSFTDVIGTSAVLWARRVSGAPADERHHYGHGKAEFLGSAFVYGTLSVLAIGIVFAGAMVIVHGEMAAPGIATPLAAGVSILCNGLMYYLGRCAGERNNSPALMANAFENRADALSSVASITGIVLAIFVHPICDPIAAMLVGVVILINAIHQLVDSLRGLMDKALPKEVVRRIETVAAAHPDVTGVEFVKTRQTGTRFWVDVGIRVRDELRVGDCDDVATAVRRELMGRSERLENVAVFVSRSRPTRPQELTNGR